MAIRLFRSGAAAAMTASLSMVASPVLASPVFASPATAAGRGGPVTTLPGDVVHDRGGWGRGGWGRGGWGHGHHDDGIDAGDIFAGLLIIGAVAAVASAASSKAKADKDDGRTDGPYRYPQQSSPRYGDEPASSGGQRDWGRSRSIDAAVDSCVAEVERGSVKVDTVEGLDRDREHGGWHIGGRTTTGDPYNCTVDGDGRVRAVTVNGRAPYKI